MTSLLDRLNLRRPPAPPPEPPPSARDPIAARHFLGLVERWAVASDASRIAEGRLCEARSDLANAKAAHEGAIEADAVRRHRWRPDGSPATRWGKDPKSNAARIGSLEAEVRRLAARVPLVATAASLAHLDVAKATAEVASHLHQAEAASLDLDDRLAGASVALDEARRAEDRAIGAAMVAWSLRGMPVDPSALGPMMDGTRASAVLATRAASTAAVSARREAEERARGVAVEVGDFERAVEAAQAHERRPSGVERRR